MRLDSPLSRLPRRWRAAIPSLIIGLAAIAGTTYVPYHVVPIRDEISQADETVYGWLYAHRGAEPPDPDVVIVPMDKASAGNMDYYGHPYPFSRDVHAQVLRNLKAAGARVVAMDIVFSDLKSAPADQAFAKAIRDCGNVILGADFSSAGAVGGGDQATAEQTSGGQDFPNVLFRDAALGFGPVDMPQDNDFQNRRFELSLPHIPLDNANVISEDYPQFAVRTAAAYRNIPLKQLTAELARHRFGGYAVPASPDDWGTYRNGRSVRICFPGRPQRSFRSFEYYKAWDANPHADPKQFPDAASDFEQLRKAVNGKIVFIGSTLEEEHDNFVTPLRETVDPKRPGVEIQACIVHTLLSRHFYRTVPEWVREIWLGALVALTVVITLIRRPYRAALPVLLLIGATAWGDVLLFNHRWVMRPAEIVLGIAAAFVLETIFLYVTEEARAKRIHQHFGRYVGPRVLDKVLDSDHVVLGGEMRHVSIMFTDVQGFTSLSEKMAPADAVNVLNLYLTKMVDCIFKYEGTLDKIMGDGIMAYFGAPAPLKNPELQSVLCAIEMQQVMEEWRADAEKTNLPPLKKRIGIHCGEVIVGEVGSANQVGYTIIGDAVNVAARLEPLNKDRGTSILISEQVRACLPDEISVTHEGEVPIRGRKEAIHAYSVQIPAAPISGSRPAPRVSE